MADGRRATLFRLGKPIVAGLALAYLVTAFVDRPAPVHFQPDNPYAAQQSAIVEPETTLVAEKNVMKLGSPLSVIPDENVPEANPLAVLEETPSAAVDVNATSPGGTSAGDAGQEIAPVPADPVEASPPGDTVPEVRGEVDTIPIPSSVTP